MDISGIVNKLLSADLKKRDSYKDVNGQGFFERFVTIPKYFFDQKSEIMEVDVQNMLGPLYLDVYSPYVSEQWGNLPKMPLEGGVESNGNYSVIDTRLSAWMGSIRKIKGTRRSFRVLFKLLNLDCLIIEHENFESKYNIGREYNDGTKWNGDCQDCFSFSIYYWALDDIPNDLYVNIPLGKKDTLPKITSFLKPIYGELLSINRIYPLEDTLNLPDLSSQSLIIKKSTPITFNSGMLYNDSIGGGSLMGFPAYGDSITNYSNTFTSF